MVCTKLVCSLYNCTLLPKCLDALLSISVNDQVCVVIGGDVADEATTIARLSPSSVVILLSDLPQDI